jgi:hypothetical protein
MIAVKKAVQLFFGLLLFQTSLFSDNTFFLESEAFAPNKRTLKPSFPTILNKLSHTKQWHRLLHFKNGESEIDDKRFFLSSQGKENPKAELEASIKQLISDKSDDDNSTICRYPSRSNWILEQIPTLKKEIKIPKCKALKKELKSLGAKHVTLILASAHINSPASAFGHTFLRIDNNPNTPLLSYAVNYAAQTTEDNGFVYAYQGLFGGYKGRYSIDPYYKKLKEYSDLEQRDVWEYTLDLTQEQIDRMVLHIFEIRYFYADYFFLAENCSYNLLWLIEVATQKSNLTNQFNFKAIPIDTLRAVVDEKLIKKTRYRPSKRKEILALSRPIQNSNRALEFAYSSDYNLEEIANLTKEEQIASLELATALLKIKRLDNKISKKEYLPKFLKILRKRSKLGKVDKKSITTPNSPKEGHLSSKASLSYMTDKVIKAEAKIAYHDIYDNDNGYISGAYISFFNTAIEYRDNKVILEEIDFLDIKSYAIQDAIFKPISWQVAVGAKRLFNNQLNSYLTAGAGVTLGRDNLYGFATIIPSIYYKKHEEHSIAGNIGLLYNPSKYLKLGFTASHEWFKDNRTIKRAEPFITYSFDQESAINIKYEYKDINGVEEKDTTLSWFWYF